METQEITLSLPKDIVEKVGLIASRRHTSVPGLLARALEELAEQEDAYARAR
jgi:predicted transcriptional regulator